MRIALVTNPSADAGFRSRAAGHLANGAGSPVGLERLLRTEYPDVMVRDGIVELDVQRWYAYREGHWVGDTGSSSTPPDGDFNSEQSRSPGG